MEDILEKVEKDETKLKHYFPKNDKYATEEETYSNDSKSGPAILAKTTFG